MVWVIASRTKRNAGDADIIGIIVLFCAVLLVPMSVLVLPGGFYGVDGRIEKQAECYHRRKLWQR